jgi:mono/diheme cytochrome c family protein
MGQILAGYIAALLVGVFTILAGTTTHAQRNGEAYATVPTVERTDYNMKSFLAPPMLTDTELRGRKLFAQRCANCHGGTAQRPGPPLGQQTVARLGEAPIREKVRKGSTMMPGFEHSLEAERIDEIIAFLKTYTPPPPPRGQGAPAE